VRDRGSPRRDRRRDACCQALSAGANAEPAGKLRLTGGGERRALLVTYPDPFEIAAANRVGKRVKGVPDQSKHMPDTDLFEHTDQDVRDRLGQERLLLLRPCPSRTVTIKAALQLRIKAV
jgi:hypothetical protein